MTGQPHHELSLKLGSDGGSDKVQTRMYKVVLLLLVAPDETDCLRGLVQVEQFAFRNDLERLFHEIALGCCGVKISILNGNIRIVDKVDADTRRGSVFVVHLIG